MTGVAVHFFETTMTRHGYIQAGSQVILPEAEAEHWIDEGYAREFLTREQASGFTETTETKRRRGNSSKMADRTEDI